MAKLLVKIVFVLIKINGEITMQLQSVKKIWDRDEHNAFSDLVRFRDMWLCTVRG